MKTYLFYYNGFCEAEVVHSIWFLKEKAISVALEDRIYKSESGQKFVPDITISKVNPSDVDLFIIPGGNPEYLYENKELKDFILELNKKNKFIAAICGGPFLLAKYGLLDGKNCTGGGSGIKPDSEHYKLFDKAILSFDSVTRDGNIITAMGSAFVELAIEVYGVLNLYKDEADKKETYDWLKNIR